MKYRVEFANHLVGQSQMPPFEVDTPEQFGVSARTADLQRRIRGRITEALLNAPAPGAATAAPVIEAHTQVIVMLGAGEGAAYYGSTTLGRFNIHEVP